jgi:ligand-binding sensor domain-containing protein
MRAHLARAVAGAALIGAAAAARSDDWKHFTAEDTPGLPGNEIQFLGPAEAGGVWVGTLNGVAHAKDGTFTPLTDKTGATLEVSVWTVLEDGKDIWVGHENGVTLMQGAARSDALPGLTVAPIVRVRPGVLWALGKTRGDLTKLYALRDGAWRHVEGLEEKRITNLYRTDDGRLWITLHGNGVLEIDPEDGLDGAVHHLESLNVTALTKDTRGIVWCGLWANGLAAWDGTVWRKELPKIRESAVLGMAEDAQAVLWVATSANGIWRRPLSKPEWTQDLADEGAINLLVATADGRVWISGQSTGGLRYWNGADWTVSLDSPLPIRALVEANDGALWAGGVLDGVYQLKETR